ncbi:hypothetical protein B7494_g3406 [Chlorociboria aeruginascens]|nr:hypothetical protein B7494_g3406 [Chlorociboria aeruginascens]
MSNLSAEPALVPDIAYSKMSYKRDAAFVTDSDLREARIILRLLDATTRAEFIEQAKLCIYDHNSSSGTAIAFSRFITRFWAGPLDIDAESPDSRRSNDNRSDRNNRRRQNVSTETEDISRLFNGPDNPGRDRASNHRHRREPSDSDFDSFSDYQDYQRRRRQRKQNQGLSYAKLRPQEFAYDGTTLITSYINRFEYLAETYGEASVLAVLPIAMAGDALNWFDSLDHVTRRAMNVSLDEWKDQLRARFQANASFALEEADSLKHSFADETKLDVRQYLTRKTQLYMEAGENNQDAVVRRLYRGLDPTLAAAVRLRSKNTIAEFCAQVYEAEPAAKGQFKQIGDLIKAQRPRPDNREKDRPARPNWQDKFPIPLEAARRLNAAVNDITNTTPAAPRYNSPLALPAPPITRRLQNQGNVNRAPAPNRYQPPNRPIAPYRNQVPVYLGDTEDMVYVDKDTYLQYLETQDTCADNAQPGSPSSDRKWCIA